jgi:ABC-type amino acid transport substrate-binding protein
MKTHWCSWFLILVLALLPASSAKAQPDTVIVGIFNIYPLAYPDENGKWVGFAVDLLAEIARATGIRYQYEVTTFVNLIPGVSTRLYDVGTGCTAITEARKALVDFTDPIFVYRYVLVVTQAENTIQTVADLTADKTVVALRGAIHENLARTRTQAQVQLVDAVPDGFDAVAAGNAHASIALDISLDEYLQTHPDAQLKIVGDALQSLDCALIVNKGQLGLLLKLNQGLSQLKSAGIYHRLYRKWFGESPATAPTPNAPTTALPQPTSIPTSTLPAINQPLTTAGNLTGVYYLTIPALSADHPATYQIVTLSANGLWLGTEYKADPTGAVDNNPLSTQRGMWQASAAHQILATVLSVTANGAALHRQDYQLAVAASGQVNGSYTLRVYGPEQDPLAATAQPSQTLAVDLTGQRLQPGTRE